jgi:aldehyde dehydrogenase (NAD+)
MPYTLTQRLGFLTALERLLDTEKAGIEAALAADFRKSPFEVMTSETSLVRHEIRQVRAAARSLLRERSIGVPLVLWPGRGRLIREPRGRVLIIAPWNFPFQLAMVPVVGAVAAGNTVVVKPSELTPATSALIASLVARVFPADLVSVVEGGVEASSALLAQPWGLIFFTGSPAVGKIVARAAAETLTPTVLELGGKSPAVVLDGADFDTAARRILWGKTMNGGQTCVAPDYVLVPRGRTGEFVAGCARALRQFYPQGAAQSPDYPALIHERAFDRVASLIAPGKVALGGGLGRSRRFVEPTVLTGVTWDDPVMQQEIFGPVLPVLEHDGPDDARNQIAKAPHPLAAYAFGPPAAARRFLSSVRAGGGSVNDVVTHFAHPGLPFGGLHTSGNGSYHGRWSLDTFTRIRGELDQPRRWDWPFRYPPYGGIREKLVNFLLH